MNTDIEKLLGDQSESLLLHRCGTIAKERLHLPGPDFVEQKSPSPEQAATHQKTPSMHTNTNKIGSPNRRTPIATKSS